MNFCMGTNNLNSPSINRSLCQILSFPPSSNIWGKIWPLTFGLFTGFFTLISALFLVGVVFRNHYLLNSEKFCGADLK